MSESISLEPNKGLRLKLDRFSPICTWHGGGNFWSHEFQLTVRQGALAGFLPRAIESDDSVLFEHRVGGVEMASTSTAITSISQVPASQLQGLRDALNELKRKAEDPHCDRTKRQMIEGFRLPDPQKDRELYRLIGKGAQQKLIVLWGVEREEGSALAPLAAVDLMHTPLAEESAPKARGKSGVLLVVLLAALAAGAWYYMEQEKAREAAREKFRAEALAVLKSTPSPSSGPTGSPTSPADKPAPETDKTPDASSSPSGTNQVADDAMKTLGNGTTGTTNADASDPTKPFDLSKPISMTNTGTNLSSASSPNPTPGASASPSVSPRPTPDLIVSKDGKGAKSNSLSPSSTPRTSPSPTSGSLSRTNSTPQATPASRQSSTPGASPTPFAKPSPSTNNSGVGNGNGTGSGSASGTFNRNRQGSWTGTGNIDRQGTTAGTPVPSPATASTLMTPNGPPPSGISSISIVSTSLSKVLDNGRVEVLLNIVARDLNGTVVDAPPIGEWRLDGVVQKKADGTLADGPVLPLNLPAGPHDITTIGRGADGKPYQTDAKVLISPKE